MTTVDNRYILNLQTKERNKMTIKYYLDVDIDDKIHSILDFEIDDKNDPVRTLHTTTIISKNLRRQLENYFDWMSDEGYKLSQEELLYTNAHYATVFSWFRQLFIDDVLRWYTEKENIYQEYEDKDLVAKIVKMQVHFKDKKVYDITQFMKA